MPIMATETKSETLNLRVTPETKAEILALAADDRRSATSLIEWLVAQERKRRSKGVRRG